MAWLEGRWLDWLTDGGDGMALTGMIWDVDGTLCDTLPLCLVAFRAVYAHHLGREFTDAEIVAGFGATEAGTIRAQVPDAWEAAEAEYLAIYERLHDEQARVFPGIIEVLATLQGRGIRQAVVTGKGPQTAAITLDRLGLSGYFDRVETGSPAGPIKPAGIRAVLDAWDCAPSTAAYVGDTPYDAGAAREVGVRAVRAAWSPTSGGMVHPAHDAALRAAQVCATPGALLAWVLAV